MEWGKLLSNNRIRDLSGGDKTTRDSSEARGEIHRDYGRAVFSTPVRRLQDKTQVFPLERLDGVRTRLTHSLEVSSMAKGLTHGICLSLLKTGKITPEQAYDIETIAATCGLLHDVGNPPFGHSGEYAIREWFNKKNSLNENFLSSISDGDQQIEGDFLNFEGNAQTIRLMCRLQVLSDRFGLNLTAATVSALCKYTANSTELKNKNLKDRQSKKKLGYYKSEQDLIELVRSDTGTGDSRNPIAFLVEASDDMTYSMVDIEDAIKKSVVSWGDFVDTARSQGIHKLNELIDESEKAIKKSTILNSLGKTQIEEGKAQYFRTFLSTYAADEVNKAFIKNYESIMSGSYDLEILYETEAGPIFKWLKKFALHNVYNTNQILKLEILGSRVIHTLLDVFWEGKSDIRTSQLGGKAYSLMSSNYKAIYETTENLGQSIPNEYYRALLVTDYVSGMTDSFALHLYQELTHGGIT